MKLWRILTSLVIVSMFLSVSLTGAFVLAGKGGGGKPKKEPPADPAITYLRGDLFVINADGSNEEYLYRERYLADPNWAPDGSAIVFLHGPCPRDLMRIDVSVVDGEPQGSNPTDLIQDVYGPIAWSPQGDVIAFTQRDGESRSIQTIPATGGEVETIYTTEGYGIGDITWRNDGTKLAFTSYALGNEILVSIVVLDLSDGSTTTVYGPVTEMIGGIDWARTKDTLAITCKMPGQSICTLDLTDPSATPVILIGEFTRNPSWSPDDSQIVFKKLGRKIKLSLCIYTLATGETEALADGSWPDWSRHVSG